ncbi:hypothetical protein CVT24_000281 [Panaeolus cyanescens]|uniref:Uncharacterized protein n=1 Tax=Panaeolus cyanescens TaxID=181874 RepID=A0A409YD90_9AGAR|nr:hypothetical protein CVT24_000281 [Panaeolus cyanescens]
METPKKRKREPDTLRVTYDAETRTFDRLFKEHSLEEMKAVIRKKMALPSSEKLHLYQVRDGKSIDLEDAEDFEAFAASARISATATVRVVIGGKACQSGVPNLNGIQVPHKSKTKKQSEPSQQTPSVASPAPDSNGTSPDSPRPAKKRRVSFVEATSSPPASTAKAASKERKDDSPSTSPPAPISKSSSEGAVDDKKKKRKKKKKSGSPVLNVQPEALNTAELSSQAAETAISNDQTSVNPPPKTSKKRPRTDANALETDNTLKATPAPVHAQAVSDEATENIPPKKKKVKHSKTENLNVRPGADHTAVAKSATLPASDIPAAETAQDQAKQKSKKRKSSPGPNQDSDKQKPSLPPNANTVPDAEDSITQKSPEVAQPKKKKPSRTKQVEQMDGIQESAEKGPPAHSAASVPDKVPASKQVKERKSKDSSEEKQSTKSLTKSPPDQQEPEKSDAAKPSKKKGAKKAKDATTEPQQGDKSSPDVKQATLAAVQAIMARFKGKDTPPQPTPTTDGETPVAEPQTNLEASSTANATKLDDSTKTVTKAVSNHVDDLAPLETPSRRTENTSKDHPSKAQESTGVGTGTSIAAPNPTPTLSAPRRVKPLSCSYCDTAPYHYRSKCKLFRGNGVSGLENRIQELESAVESGAEDAQRQAIITELKQEVENKVGRPYRPPNPQTTAKTQNTPKSSAAPPDSTPSIPSQVESTSARVHASKRSARYTPPAEQEDARGADLGSENSAPPVTESTFAGASEKISARKPPRVIKSPNALQKENNLKFPSFSPFLDARDISNYTEKDLEALIRGPPVTAKDVPSTETSEEEQEEERESLVDDEDEDADKVEGKYIRPNYASSSEDDQDDDDDGPSEGVNKAGAPLEPPKLARAALEKQTSPTSSSSGDSSSENFREGNISFQEMEALGSSGELDRTGDVAFEKAYANDISSISGNPLLTYGQSNDLEANPLTQTAMCMRSSSEESEDEIVDDPTSDKPDASNNTLEQDDPIENEDPTESPEMTPRSVPVQTTTRENPADNSVSRSPATDKQLARDGSTESHSQAAVQDTTPKAIPPKRKGVLTPISELPIPPHPGTRVIKLPLAATPTDISRRLTRTPARGGQPVAAVHVDEARAELEVPADPPTRVTRRSSRTAVAASSVTTPARASTVAKPVVEEDGDGDAEVPRTRLRTSSRLQLRASSAQPENTPTTPGSKAFTAKSTTGKKGHAKLPSKAPNASNQKKQVVEQAPNDEVDAPLGTLPVGNTSLTSWATLPEEGDSQTMNDSYEMKDELLPSSNPAHGSSSPNDDGGVDVDAGSTQSPLFLHSATQQSLPYSQYPDLGTKAMETQQESDEEDEVEAVVQMPEPISAPRYRGLTALQGVKNFSRPTLRPARFEQKPVEDLYGRSGKDSDSSDGSDSSDSEAEGKSRASHIPESRRAGAQTTRRK